MRKFSLILIFAALGLSACFSQPYPSKNYYSLMAEVSVTGAAPKTKPYTLVLGAVNAASGFEDRFLVYRVGPNQFESDFYNELVAAPARLLADLAAQRLDSANPRLRVVKSPGMKLADFGLEIYLESLYGDFTGENPRAMADIRFTLNDLRSSQAKIVLDKSYHCDRPIMDKKPAALVAGLNVCVNEMLTELNQDIEKVIR